MAKPTIKIIDLESGQEVEREMNAEELKQFEKDEAEAVALAAEAKAKATQKAALLEKLGINEDEAKLLLS